MIPVRKVWDLLYNSLARSVLKGSQSQPLSYHLLSLSRTLIA